MPSLYVAALVSVPRAILPRPWFLPKVRVALVEDEDTEVIVWPIPKDVTNLSTVSLVILFFKSLVFVSPIGARRANVFAAGGLDSTLSLSNWG